MFLDRNGNKLVSENMIPFEEVNDQIWDLQAEIFIPAAASRLISKEQVDNMIETGLEVISCGANVPFADEEIFYGPISEFADQHISVIPDFIANCGMARVFAFLMQGEVEMKDDNIFKDTSDTIRIALEKIRAKSNSKVELTKLGFEASLAQLV